MNRPAMSAVITPSTSTRRADGGRELLTRYVAQLRTFPQLTVEEEQFLTQQYRATGDPKYSHRLITANLFLVMKLALGYRRSWTHLLDLVQEGNVGLVRAIEKFDPLRGVRFTSYAQYWIRAYILQYVINNVSLVNIGRTRTGRKLFYRLQKEKTALIAEGLTPTVGLLSERLGVRGDEIECVSARLSSREVSLDVAGSGDQPGVTMADMVAAHEGFSPEKAVADNETEEQLRSALRAFHATLVDERDAIVWSLRMATDTPISLAELGQQFGLSKERVRQVETRLRVRARRFLTETHGKEGICALLDLTHRLEQGISSLGSATSRKRCRARKAVCSSPVPPETDAR